MVICMSIMTLGYEKHNTFYERMVLINVMEEDFGSTEVMENLDIASFCQRRRRLDMSSVTKIPIKGDGFRGEDSHGDDFD